jgi:hypothetical protein
MQQHGVKNLCFNSIPGQQPKNQNQKRTGTFLNYIFNGYKKTSFFWGGSGEAFVPYGA